MDEKLAGLEPRFAELISNILQRASDLKPPIGVFMGLRSWQQQDYLYSLGRTVKNMDGYSKDKPFGNIVTKARGGDSWHNYGLAVDIVFKPAGAWSWDPKLPWKKLGELAENQGLEWGGRWKFVDLPHVQMISGLEIFEAKKLFSDGGIEAIWKEVNFRRLT